MRLFRVSFTGELGYEVNVPADYGQAVWEAMYAAGQSHGITPYGTETMHVLRAEKGYIIVGQETDGTVTPDDAGLGWAIARSKPDFVGKRSLDARDHARSGPQAAGRIADRGPQGGAGGRCADRCDARAARTDEDDRPRYVLVPRVLCLDDRLRSRWCATDAHGSVKRSTCRCPVARLQCKSP